MTNYAFNGWTADNFGAPSTAHNYGPFNISNLRKLLRIKAVLGVGWQAGVFATTDTTVDFVTWGVQFGPAGYTPSVLPANLGGGNFVWSELLDLQGAHAAAWAPSGASGEYVSAGGVGHEWKGQQFVGRSTDFYVTTGAAISGAPAWSGVISLTVDNTY